MSIVTDFVAEMQRKAYPEHRYLSYHAPRYELLVNMLGGIVNAQSRVLDIGRSLLTELIAKTYGCHVDSLGFAADVPTDTGNHWHYDLNDAQERSKWRSDFGPYDVIVMAEVIEHLYTSPALVLGFLNSLLVDGGYLVVQTPNAVALHKRLTMLLGRHPYTQINEDATNPLHFREYTKGELFSYAKNAGFAIDRCVAGQYFDYRYANRVAMQPRNAVVNATYRILPSALKPGLTLVLRKVSAS